MTREEALEVIKSHPFLFASFPDDVIEALDVLINQEPVIDKIRTEIRALSNANPSYWHSGDMVERDDVLEILDEYKAESERVEDGNDD